MGTPLPIQNLTMNKILAKNEGGLARANQYQVSIVSGWGADQYGTPFIRHLKNNYGLIWNGEFQEKLSIACSNVNLPSSTYATGEVKDNYIGVGQEYAHTRVNTDIDFTFYLDRNYEILTFFEAWIDFISGNGVSNTEDKGYFRRFAYPKFYKNFSGLYITKFEKNWNAPNARNMTYQLINAFPKSMASIPLQYGEAEVMKVSVTINYDRYRLYRSISGTQIKDLPDSATKFFPYNIDLGLGIDYSKLMGQYGNFTL